MQSLELDQCNSEELTFDEMLATDGGGWVDIAIGVIIDNIDSFAEGMQDGFYGRKK